jgi:hypothetical protein
MSPSKSAAMNAAAAAPDAALPADVKLPEHGGFVAHFVDAGETAAARCSTHSTAAVYPSACWHRAVSSQLRHQAHQQAASSNAISRTPSTLVCFSSAGAKDVKLSNPYDEAVEAACRVAPASLQGQQQQLVPLQSLEQQLADLIGPPHNYDGIPQPAAVAPAVAVDEQAAAAANPASISNEGTKDTAACAAPGSALGLHFPAALGGKAAASPGANALWPGLEELAAAAEVRGSHARTVTAAGSAHCTI